MEENDVDGGDCRIAADKIFRIPGEYTDMEISRVGVFGTVCVNLYSTKTMQIDMSNLVHATDYGTLVGIVAPRDFGS